MPRLWLLAVVGAAAPARDACESALASRGDAAAACTLLAAHDLLRPLPLKFAADSRRLADDGATDDHDDHGDDRADDHADDHASHGHEEHAKTYEAGFFFVACLCFGGFILFWISRVAHGVPSAARAPNRAFRGPSTRFVRGAS